MYGRMDNVLGLDSSWYDVALVEIPMISTNVDMFALIHPTEGNFENVEAAIKNYQIIYFMIWYYPYRKGA